MKTMNDFKGTQGEFKESDFRKGAVGVYPNNPIDHIIVCQVYGSGLEAEANARLFANSKKVLEAAIDAANVLRLTSQADGVSSVSKAALSKLEQAINDSL